MTARGIARQAKAGEHTQCAGRQPRTEVLTAPSRIQPA